MALGVLGTEGNKLPTQFVKQNKQNPQNSFVRKKCEHAAEFTWCTWKQYKNIVISSSVSALVFLCIISYVYCV